MPPKNESNKANGTVNTLASVVKVNKQTFKCCKSRKTKKKTIISFNVYFKNKTEYNFILNLHYNVCLLYSFS